MKKYFFEAKIRDVVLDFFAIVLWIFLLFTKNWTLETFTVNIIASVFLTFYYYKLIAYIRANKIERDRRIAAYENIYEKLNKVNHDTTYEEFHYNFQVLENFLNEYNDRKLFHILHSKLLTNYRGEIM